MSSLISFTGMASGLDTGSIVSALVQAESLPLRRMQTTKTQLGSKSSKLEEINSLLNTLKSAAEELSSLEKVQAATASTSQEDSMRVTTNGGAVPGQYDLEIIDVAKNQKTYSDGIENRYTGGLFSGEGTFSITVGSDAAVDISVDADTSLEDLVSAINTSGADVTAGIMYDGTDHRLMISGNRGGTTEGVVSFASDVGTLGLDDPANIYQTSSSASFRIDGFLRSSESNSITDAVPGVTIDLLAQTDGNATVTVERDTEALAEKMDSFVKAYNNAMGKVNSALTTRSEDNSAASLFGDSTLRSIRQKMESSLLSAVSGLSGQYTTARSVGLSLDRDGELSFDRDDFDDAVATDITSLAALFQENTGTGTEGIMARMGTVLESITDAKDGMIANRIDGIDDRKRALDDQIARAQGRLDDYEQRLQSQFIAMEQVMSKYQAQGNQLQAILGQLIY